MTTLDQTPGHRAELIADPAAATQREQQARAALAELITKRGLPEPAAVRWHEYLIGRYHGYLTLTAHTRDHVATWADVMHRKVRTEQRIRETEYDPTLWYCAWDTSVELRNWLPNVQLRVYHDESRYAKTAAAMLAERDELIERAMSYQAPAGAR